MKNHTYQIKFYSNFFKALSDPTRFSIVLLLSKGELCVCKLESALRAPQAKISRHLAYLRKHGIVNARRQWKWMYYSLFTPRNKFEKRMLKCLEGCLEEDKSLKKYFVQMKECILMTMV